MALFAALRSFWRIERRRKLALLCYVLLVAEIICRGMALLIALRVSPADLRERIAAIPPGIRNAWPAVTHVAAGIEIALLVLIGVYALYAFGLQLWWQLLTWPRACERRTKPGHLLEIMPATDSAVRFPAMESLLAQVFALLQADRGKARRGEATTLSLEYWSGAAGTRLYSWLPADIDERLLGAFAEQLRAAYPGVRLRQADDPLYAALLLAKGRQDAALGVREYGLRTHSDFPLRDPASFSSDPLAGLVAVLQTDAATPLTGLEIVLTAYNGAWRDDVARRIELLRARELAVQRKAALPATHAAEVRAFGRQSDQLGFDTVLRAVALGTGAEADKVVQGRLDRVTRQLTQYDTTLGAIRQGLIPTRTDHDHPAAGRPANELLRLLRQARAKWIIFTDRNDRKPAAIKAPIIVDPAVSAEPGAAAGEAAGAASVDFPDWVRAALDRRPRPLDPLGRRLHVLGARELATLWYLPTKELLKLPGLNCWQRAQVFPAPSGVRVPGGEAAREWMITGVVPREVGAANGRPRYIGLRRAALNQHVYVNGPTRSGKTKLLENLTSQDLQAGLGVGVIDPKGDYARKTILMTPWEREGEVCYFNPLDSERRIMGVNPLERAAVERLGRDLVQSGAIGILGSLGAGWEQAPLGKRFMQHALALLLDAAPEPTFLHLYRLLQHSRDGNPYRDELLARANPATAQNYSLVAADFWANQVPGMKESQLSSLQTALTRTESFLSNERVLQIVAQPASTFSLRRMMDSKGIFVASVTAELGGDLQKFVGTLLMTMITQAGFSRNNIAEGKREFWRLTVDEFQKFIAMSGSAESFEDLLSMLGGLGVGLTMAHQAFKQLPPDLLGIILGNVGTRIFYPSQEDAAAIAARLGGQVRREDQLYLERFWTTQVLPMASGSSGPVTVAPLPLAPVAATPGVVRAVSEAVLTGPLVRRWGRATVETDELASGALRDLVTAPAGEDEAGQKLRLAKLVQVLYGAERDEQVVTVLCGLSAGDFKVYREERGVADGRLRRQMLAYRRLCGDELNEETKLRRIATLSDLAYGTPVVEVRAQIARVMQQGLVSGIAADMQFDGVNTATAGEKSAAAKAGAVAPEVETRAATAATFEEQTAAQPGEQVAVPVPRSAEAPPSSPADQQQSAAQEAPVDPPVSTLLTLDAQPVAEAVASADREPRRLRRPEDSWQFAASNAVASALDNVAEVAPGARSDALPLERDQTPELAVSAAAPMLAMLPETVSDAIEQPLDVDRAQVELPVGDMAPGQQDVRCAEDARPRVLSRGSYDGDSTDHERSLPETVAAPVRFE